MLILKRRPGEAVQIGDSVRVKVLGVQGNSVRLGIDAPRDVPVDREEIYERKRGETGGDAEETDSSPQSRHSSPSK